MRSLSINFFNILLFSLFTLSVSSQDGPVSSLGTVTNGGDGFVVPYEFCLEEGNQLTVMVNVLLGNLEIAGNPPNYYGVLPEGAPDMYVEFTVNGVTSTVQVGNFDIVTLPNGNTAFSFIAESPAFDFSDECAASENGAVYANIKFRLVTMEDGESVTYPACDYQNTLFSCYIYDYAPWCDESAYPAYDTPGGDPLPSCEDEWFSGGYTAKLLCNCDDPVEEHHSPKGGENINGDDEDITNRYVENAIINVFPNPMGQILQIQSDNNSIRRVEVYTSSGDLIIANAYASETMNVTLNTSELPSGLYLARITTASGIKIIKVLK